MVMERKSTFQLIQEHYDIQEEARKVERLFYNEKYFEDSHTYYSLSGLINHYCFIDWEYRGTCLNVKEYIKKANAIFPDNLLIDEDILINFLEVIHNFIYIYSSQSSKLNYNYHIKTNSMYAKVFCPLVYELEKHMGLEYRLIENKILLYPQNAQLEQVLNIVENDRIEWELICYAREKLPLTEKRDILNNLARELNIEKSKQEKDTIICSIMDETTNILNNAQLRHNNEKKNNDSTEVLKSLSDNDMDMLYDKAFNNMLIITLKRANASYDVAYKKFVELQRVISNN